VAAAPAYLALRFGYALAFALFATVATLRRVTVIGLDPLELVLVGTVLEVTVFLAEVPTGALADLRGRKLSLGVGHALIGTGFALESLAGGFAAVLAAQVVWGLGATFVSGAREAWIADEVGEVEAARLYLRGAQAAQAGSLIGIGAAALLGSAELSLAMRASAALLLGGATLLMLGLPERGFTPPPAEARRGLRSFVATLQGGAGALRARPVLVTLLGAAFLLGAASDGLDRLWELHLMSSFGLTAQGGAPVGRFAALRAAALVAGVAAVALARRRVDPSRPEELRRALLWIHGLLVAALLALAGAPGLLWAAAAWLATAALREAQDPLFTAWLNRRLDPHHRATLLSLASQSGALGEIAGGPALGAALRPRNATKGTVLEG
jgi:DHA3 family tetracycline resistance protein-like MFS transporter